MYNEKEKQELDVYKKETEELLGKERAIRQK